MNAPVVALPVIPQPPKRGRRPKTPRAPVVHLYPSAHEEARTYTLDTVNAMLLYVQHRGDNSPERHQVEATLREAQKRLRHIRMERVAAAAIRARLLKEEK